MPSMTLRRRLVIPLACVLIAYGGFHTYLTVRTQSTEVLSEATLSTVRLANTIRRSTRNAMLQSRGEDVRKMIEDVGQQEGIGHVRELENVIHRAVVLASGGSIESAPGATGVSPVLRCSEIHKSLAGALARCQCHSAARTRRLPSE